MATNQNRQVSQWKSFVSSIGGCSCEVPTKQELYETIMEEMMIQENEMFEIKGLPNTIPNWYIVSLLQTNGFCGIFKKDNKLYASFGSLGGKLDYNYFPKNMIITNPYLNMNETLEIGKDIALIKHDRYMVGLNQWNKIHAYNLAEAWLSLRLGLINCRAENLISADNDNEAQGALDFIKDLEEGIHIAHIKASMFLDKNTTTSIPFSSGAINSIRSAVETMQYIKSDWASGVGLNSSYSTKREYTSSDETSLGYDMLRPKIDQILDTVNSDLEIANKMFGTNFKAEFKSVWKQQKEETMLEQEILEDEAKGGNEDEAKDNLQQDK